MRIWLPLQSDWASPETPTRRRAAGKPPAEEGGGEAGETEEGSAPTSAAVLRRPRDRAVMGPMVQAPGLLRLVLTLAAGALAVSFGSILVKEAQEAPSLSIAFYRMFWASVLLLPAYLVLGRRRASSPGTATAGRRLWLLLAGVSLALHFAFWISSLRYTSVAVSVLLVNTAPALVASVSFFLFGERLTGRGLAGIGLAMAGAFVLVRHDLERAGDWRGPALALGGAAALGLYFLAGRWSQRTSGLWDYVYPVYVVAGVILGGLALASGAPLSGFSPRTWMYLLLLGAIPQCVGHTCYNWSLKHLPATLVSTLVLAEPVLAPALAWLFLGEGLGLAELQGGTLVAAGILLVSRGGVRLKAPSPEPVEVAVGVLIRQGRVWVRRRSGTGHLDGLLEFPGGKLEAGESPQEAALREIQEETGLAVNPASLRLLRVEDFSYPSRTVRIHFFACLLEHGKPAGPGYWTPAAELREEDFPPANREVLRLLASNYP